MAFEDEKTREPGAGAGPETLTATNLNLATDSDSTDVDNPVEAQEADDKEDEYPHGAKLILLSAAALASVFLVALDQTIVGTAIPKITEDFHGLEDVSWYAAAYFMTFGGSQTSAGKLYKYFSLKWSFLGSLLVFEVGSLICGVAPNSKALVVGRAIAGLGGAGMSVGGTSIISFAVPPVKRPLMMGFFGMTYCLSAVLGPLIGGAFTATVTWRWCFYINLPIGGVAALAILLFFKLPAAATPPDLPLKKKLLHLDPVGIGLVMGAITCFILALQYGGNSHAWSSSLVIGLLVGFVLIAVAILAWEMWLGEYAMILPRLYKQRSLWSASSFQFFFMGSYVVLLYYLPIYFQSIKGASAIRSGVDNLPLVLSAAVFTLVGGIVVMKTGRPQQVMMAGSALTAVGYGLIYTFDIDTSQARWVGYQFFTGTVLSFSIMHGLSVVQAYVDSEDLAAATGNLLFWQVVGGAFSTSAAQSAFINRMLATLPRLAPGVDPVLVISTGASELRRVFPADVLPGVLEAYMTGVKAAYAVGIAFAGTACLLSLTIPWKKLPTHEPGDAPMAMA